MKKNIEIFKLQSSSTVKIKKRMIFYEDLRKIHFIKFVKMKFMKIKINIIFVINFCRWMIKYLKKKSNQEIRKLPYSSLWEKSILKRKIPFFNFEIGNIKKRNSFIKI